MSSHFHQRASYARDDHSEESINFSLDLQRAASSRSPDFAGDRGGASATRALPIRQPWAWLIIHAYKDVENRPRRLHFLGRIYVHASQGMTRPEYEECRAFVARIRPALQLPAFAQLERGGIVGVVDLTGCVDESSCPLFCGPHGYTLAHAEPLPFRAMKGALGLFKVAAPIEAR